MTRTSKRGSHAGTPLQYHIEQHDEAYPQQVLSCYLPAVKAVNWMISRLRAAKGDGRITDPRAPGITKLSPNSKPQEKRGAEIQWLPAVEYTAVKEVLPFASDLVAMTQCNWTTLW